MFDLEQSIAEWRRQMLSAGLKTPVPLEELESHLRDEFEQQIRQGVEPRQAFEAAVRRMGRPESLRTEFGRAHQFEPSPQRKMMKSFAAAVMILFLLSLIVAGLSQIGLAANAMIWICAVMVVVPAMIWRWRRAGNHFILRRNARSVLNKLNLTPDAKQTLALAREEAPRLRHDFIGTEHVLLGLLESQTGTVCRVMQRMGVDSANVRREIEKWVGLGQPAPRVAARIPFTPRAQKALWLAVNEAKSMHHVQVGVEHIFLGLLREGHGVAALALRNLGVDVERTRAEILKEAALGE